MADIELVIKLPEDLYKATVNGLDANEIWDLRLAVKNGTPLPKGHGRLIDADALLNNSNIYAIWLNGVYKDCILTDVINDAPAIIESDEVETEAEDGQNTIKD